MKAQSGEEVFLRIHDAGARWGWLVNVMPRALHLRRRPGIHWTEGFMGLGAGLDGYGRSRSPPPGLKPRTIQPIASRYIEYAILATLRLFIFAGNNTSIYTIKRNRVAELVTTKEHALADYVHVTWKERREKSKH